MPRKEEKGSYNEKISKLFDEIVFGEGGSDDKKLKRLFGYFDKSEYAEVYTITVCGNGFLYNMVRILAGEIFAVGCGKETKIIEAFETGERCLLAKTMPAKGLVMLKAEYAFERGDKEDD